MEPNQEPEDNQDEEMAPTPFDHPFFLPAVFLGFTLWFGYDVFFNPEMMEEHPYFNVGGLIVFSLLTVYYGFRGYQEYQAEQSSKPKP